MKKEDAIFIINGLHLPDERKQALLQQVEAGGVTPELVKQLRQAFNEADDAIRSDYADEIKELNEIYQTADKEMGQAYQDFEKEMTAIDEEGQKVYDQAAQQAEQMSLDDARAAIQ